MSRTARIERVTKETKVLVEIDLDGTGKGDLSHRRRLLRPHAQPARQARRVRPDRAHRGRPGDRRAPHHGGHRDRAGRGLRAGARRQGRASGGTARPPSRWTRCSCRAAVDLSGRPYVVHDEPELAPYIGPVYPTSMTRHIFESFGFAAKVTLHVERAARGPRRRPAGRPPRGGGPVQGVLPGAARGRRDRPAQRRRAAVDQGRALMAIVAVRRRRLPGRRRDPAGQVGRHQVQRRPGRGARRAGRRRRRGLAAPGEQLMTDAWWCSTTGRAICARPSGPSPAPGWTSR